MKCLMKPATEAGSGGSWPLWPACFCKNNDFEPNVRVFSDIFLPSRAAVFAAARGCAENSRAQGEGAWRFAAGYRGDGAKARDDGAKARNDGAKARGKGRRHTARRIRTRGRRTKKLPPGRWVRREKSWMRCGARFIRRQ